MPAYLLTQDFTAVYAYWTVAELQAPGSELKAMTKQSNAPYPISLIPFNERSHPYGIS